MMRLNVKVAIVVLSTLGLVTMIVLWSVCDKVDTRASQWRNPIDLLNTAEIDCDINNDYVIGCRKDGDEVYLPFSFLHKYFEVYGKLATYDGLVRFEWSHSYSKVYHPKGKYDSRGVFLYFENYNVEVRDRVKCVSGIEGVPISTQWESQGYFYPTQIAQFGLSHYSKNLTEPEPRKKIFDDSEKNRAKWLVPSSGIAHRIYSTSVASTILNFKTLDYFEPISLKMDHVLNFILSINLKLNINSSFQVILQNRENGQFYNLHYITSDILLTVQDHNIYHGIGTSDKWRKITRDLIVDLQKGLGYLDKDKSKHRIPRSKLKITAVILRGSGSLDNLTISSSEHIQQFYDAAEWFIKYQDKKTGGWPIPVKRKLAAGFHDLQAGWYSAMGQGHALSILSRAYYHSGGDSRYLKSALLALRPFHISSEEGGVLATFLDKYRWYEEYPTSPPSFVLNGFIYALLGLYDLISIAPQDDTDDARTLFNDGLASLKAMLMFFDMGSVTSYDLRHITLSIAPNLARWDYHATHVNQLLLLSTIVDGDVFKATAERWIGYMSGKRAAHN